MLTVQFHVQDPIESKGWREVDSDRYDCKKFEETMSDCESRKIKLKIILYTLISFGIYYLRLKCTNSGQSDLQNLQNKRIVHYISLSREEDLKIANAAKNSLYRGLSKDLRKREEWLQARENVKAQQLEKQLKNTSDTEVMLGDSILKSCMQEVKAYRKIAKDLEDIIDNKRIYFLEHLYNQNRDLTFAIEKYFNLNEEETTNENLIKLLYSFLNDDNIKELISQAIQAAKKMDPIRKTVFHQKFELFREAYWNLENKPDWLIAVALQEEAVLFDYIVQLFKIGNSFKTTFINLYYERENTFNRCLEIMSKKLTPNPMIKNEVEESFLKWKKLLGKIEKNLAAKLNEKTELRYTLSDYFKDELSRIGFNSEFIRPLLANEITASYIKNYFSGHSTDIFNALSKLIEDPLKQSEALRKCQKKIDEELVRKQEAKKNLESSDFKVTLEVLNEFINQAEIYDAVILLVEGEYFIKAQYPNYHDPEFFKFLQKLEQTDFFAQKIQPQANESLYIRFQPFFGRIRIFKEIIEMIVS